MFYKRLQLSAIFLLVLCITELQAQTIFIKQSNGSQTAYAISNVRKVTFSAGYATIHKTDNSIGLFELIGLRYINFTDLTNINDKQIYLYNENMHTYPNPVINVLNIDLTNTIFNGTLSILTLDGRIIQKFNTKGENILNINIENLPTGIYLCRYSNTLEIKTFKIIKQ